MRKVKIIIAIIVGCISLFYFFCFHYTENYEFGITYNIFSGKLDSDKHTGYHITLPWVQETTIDARPMKVCIVSASRNMNCRLIQFDTTKYRELIQREGFHYFWWYNRFSFNSGQETYRGVSNLLLGYSYGSNRYPCVKILQEVGDDAR
jgi:hypothetical protein